MHLILQLSSIKNKAHGLYGLFKHYCYILKVYPTKYPRKVLPVNIRLDLNKKKIVNINNNEEIDVLCKEFLLLECLLRNKDQVVSREFIYDYVWGMDNESVSNNLEAYISFIRRKFKAIDSTVNIKALRGLGYKLEVNHE